MNNLKTIFFIALFLVLYSNKNKFFILNENFDNTEFNKLPKMSYVQDIELKKLLKIIHLLLIEHKIEYSMCGGTLLGSIRHKNRIPWDDDADIFILDKYEKNIENINWVNYGCKLVKHWIGYKLCFIDNKKAIENDEEKFWTFPFVDIFVVTNIDDKWVYKNEKCRQFWPLDFFYKSELFPLKEYQFGDIMLYGPNKPYRYLTRFFGKGWETNVEIHTSHIIGKDLKQIKFTIADYSKIHKLVPINYLWVFGNFEKYSEDYLIDKLNNEYTLVFINNNTLKEYLIDIFDDNFKLDVKNEEQMKHIKKSLFEKYGGKFLII